MYTELPHASCLQVLLFMVMLPVISKPLISLSDMAQTVTLWVQFFLGIITFIVNLTSKESHASTKEGTMQYQLPFLPVIKAWYSNTSGGGEFYLPNHSLMQMPQAVLYHCHTEWLNDVNTPHQAKIVGGKYGKTIVCMDWLPCSENTFNLRMSAQVCLDALATCDSLVAHYIAVPSAKQLWEVTFQCLCSK